MNRQQRRLTKKAEAARRAAPRPQVKPAPTPARKERTSPRQFLREVVAEMRKVAWPSRQEVVAYSIVVLISSIVIAAIVFGMDYVFAKAVYALFGVEL